MSIRDHDRLTSLGCAAATLVGVALLLPSQASAAGWNLYQNYTTSYYIPFVPNNGITAPRRLRGGENGDVRIDVDQRIAARRLQIDTGSQGVVIPQYLLPGFVQSPNLQKIAYSTSGNYAMGTWSTATITFDGSSIIGPPTASVRRLRRRSGFRRADRLQFVGDARRLHAGVDRSRVLYDDGVGFGRPDSGWGPDYLPSLANNALVNITGMAQGTLNAGYILTPTGIEAGLTAQNTAGNFAYLKLMQETIAGQSGIQWATAPGSVTIANQSGTVAQYGTMILMDTGITHFYGSTGTTYSNATPIISRSAARRDGRRRLYLLGDRQRDQQRRQHRQHLSLRIDLEPLELRLHADLFRG